MKKNPGHRLMQTAAAMLSLLGTAAALQLPASADEPYDVYNYNYLGEAVPSQAGSHQLCADGEDLAFVTVSLVDKKGTLIPQAADQLEFSVTGTGSFRAVCNGDATSTEVFTEPTMKLFNGQLVVVVQAADKPGKLTLTVTDRQRGLKQRVVIPVL